MTKIKLFNIPPEEDVKIPDRKIYVLVIYDISDTKRRNKLVKILKGYGYRVQKSAFEVLIDHAKFKKLLNAINKFYKQSEDDQIRVYRFRGEADVTIYGDEKLVENIEDVFI